MAEDNKQDLIVGLSESDAAIVRNKLLRLLAKQARLYTMGDSSSVRIETANELLASICYTLKLYLTESGNSPLLLCAADAGELFCLGQGIIERMLDEFELLYPKACLGAPELENLSFNYTLRSIGSFRRSYDYRLFARDICCCIDYQLCRPVPESLYGVQYVNEYLRRIIIENDFLSRFSRKTAARLLDSCYKDYKYLPLNLYEPIAVNALGLTLIGSDPSGLDISEPDRAKIADMLAPLSIRRLGAALLYAADKLCLLLGIGDAAAREYLSLTAKGLCPRIDLALTAGGLDAIFVSMA